MLLIAFALASAALFAFFFRLALLGRRAKRNVDAGAITGQAGRAETEIDPEGMVFVRGELWKARAQGRIGRGERVRVVGARGVTLEVEAQTGAAAASTSDKKQLE